jgi:hypothetical protein
MEGRRNNIGDALEHTMQDDASVVQALSSHKKPTALFIPDLRRLTNNYTLL